MSLVEFLKIVRRRLLVVLSVFLVGTFVALVLFQLTPRSYTATANGYVVVDVSTFESENAGSFYSASQLANQKAQAFASVITSNAVAEGVAIKLDLNADPALLASRVSATSIQNSSTIRVTSSSGDPVEAQRIADCFIEVAAERLKELEGEDSPIRLKLLSSASLAAVRVSPSPLLYVGSGLILSLAAGLFAAVAIESVDRKIRLSADVEEITTVPVVSVLPQASAIGRESSDKDEKDFQSEEAVRKLRTNLRFASVDDELKVCVVSSPSPAEGKSSVAFRLAQVMAAAGEDVVLIDADLRRPTVDKSFGVDGTLGLSQVLASSVPLDRALQKTDYAGLYVLPAGQIPPNPSELLGSEKMAELVDTLSKELFVILDAPPLLPVTDAAVLSRIASGLLLVVRAGRTKTDEMETALENVERAGGKVVGIVLNGVSTSKTARLRYGNREYLSNYYTSHYDSTDALRGEVSDFNVRAAMNKDLPGSLVERVDSFDSVISPGPPEPRRRRPHFKPVGEHAER